MTLLHSLSKKISRKNLYKLICNELNKITEINCLNIGSGGPIEELLKKKVKNYYSIDIDQSRKPNEIMDVCSNDFKVNFNPNLICIFETLEHCQNPIKAVDNIHKTLDKGNVCLASVPFNFHIHDEPNDFFRFTEYGCKLIFKNFSEVKVLRRNGWLESIFVNIVRLEKESNILSKIIGKLFIILNIIFYPIIIIIQKIAPSKKLTTGYFIIAVK
tara:strand:- start:4275 stop:4919 length:645 start_codon:yes stop_codon:yes gene_type:complete